MKRKKFTEEEKAELLKSRHITKVGTSNASYSEVFKKHAVAEYMKGEKSVSNIQRSWA